MSEPGGPGESEREERRRRVMERLAEMLQGPSPDRGGAGPVTGGGVEAAIAQLGLGLSEEDRGKVADALGEGPDPEEAAALFATMLEAFQAWQRRPGTDEAAGSDDDDDASG